MDDDDDMEAGDVLQSTVEPPGSPALGGGVARDWAYRRPARSRRGWHQGEHGGWNLHRCPCRRLLSVRQARRTRRVCPQPDHAPHRRPARPGDRRQRPVRRHAAEQTRARASGGHRYRGPRPASHGGGDGDRHRVTRSGSTAALWRPPSTPPMARPASSNRSSATTARWSTARWSIRFQSPCAGPRRNA